MNQLIKIIVCCVLVLQLQAQQKTSHLSNTKNAQNTSTNWQAYKKTTAQSAQKLALNKTALLLNKEDKLHLMRTNSDQVGMKHYRYQQTYKDIPVEGAVYLMHERAGKVELSNGQLVNGLNINTKPSIDVRQAQKLAIGNTGASQYALLSNPSSTKRTFYKAENYRPKGSLVIVDPQFSQNAANYRLAYKFEIFATQPLLRKDVYVDAQNGHIILTLEKLHACNHTTANGLTNYANTVDFEVCEQANGSHILEHEMPFGKLSVRDYSNVKLPVVDADNYFDENLAANEVHYFTQKTLAYFSEKHGRSLEDNVGIDSLTTSVVNYVKNNNDPNNSYYVDGIGLYYGAGDSIKYTSLSSADMVGHELVHGLTKFEAGLLYKGESGALNESFSDIFGEMVENYCKSLKDTTQKNDWIIGGDYTILPGKNGSRSMKNPKDDAMLYKLPHTYKGDNWVYSPNDNSGVHFNSGVQNYWFYLLSEGGSGTNDLQHQYQIEGIGKTKAAQIAYYNLTNYLTPTSNYVDARLGSIEAAQILFRDDTTIVEQTKAAWEAVGVHKGCLQLDQEALDTLLAKGIANDNWYTDNFENWKGIETNENGCVTRLSIIKKNSPAAENEIPDEIGNFTHLKTLELQNLNLTGTMPYAIANLDFLDTLNLSQNKLSGTILPEIGYLNKLEHVDFTDNQLSGCFDRQLLNLCNQLYPSYIYTQYFDAGNDFELSWKEFCDYKGVCTPCRVTDSLTLIKVYEAFNGENWTTTWDLSQPMTQWHGVTLSENGCVQGLYLQNNNLTGILTPLIGDLVSLYYLYLQDNHLEGSLPYELLNIRNIGYIDLSNNNLSGCYNSNLIELNYKWDDAFDCNNKISDGNHFVASWCDFSQFRGGDCNNYLAMNCRERDSLSLRVLYETTEGANWKNKWDLNTPMDQWYGVTLNNNGCVTNLKITDNYMEGFIPNQIGYLTELRNLNLTNNQLSGGIPESLGQLDKLTELKLIYNQLTGDIPASMGNMTNLLKFYAYSNQLSGELPVELSKLKSMNILSLHKNQLSGTIPVEFEGLSNLSALSLSENQLSGSIPAELGNLPKLNTLNVDQNQLKGNIPSNLANLDKLITLKVNDNDLSGCYAPNLSILCDQLSVNNFSVISEDNNFEETWDKFCDTGDGFCDDPVWPGDFNNDGLVNYNDMLYWGLAEGKQDGPQRPLGTIDWAAQNSATWNEFIGGIDVKHQDANGDGMINEHDLTAFEQNYGKIADDFENLNPQNAEIEFELKLSEYSATLLKFDILVKSNVADSIDIHGFSCSLNFSDFIVDTIFLENSNSAFPYDRSETFYDRERGIYDISLTKTDQQNTRVKNGGVVETMVICLPVADIQGDPPSIKLEGGGILDAYSKYSGVWKSSTYAYDPVEFNAGGLPFNNLPITIVAKHEHCNGLGSAYVNVNEGYGIPPFTYLWNTGETNAEISNLTSGIYTVSVNDANGKTNIRTIQIDGQIPAFYSDGSTKCESDCAEYLSLPIHITDGIYQAEKNILFSGDTQKHQNIEFIAGENIELYSGASIEEISISINNCHN